MTDHISWKKKIKTKRERKANPSNLIPDLNPWVFWRRIINFNIEQSYRKRGSSIQNEVTKGWVFRYNTCLYTNTEITWSIYLVNKWMYKLINEYAVKFAWKIPHEVWGNHPSSLKPRLCTYVSHFYMPDICWQLSISYCNTKIGYHRPAALRASGTLLCLAGSFAWELTTTWNWLKTSAGEESYHITQLTKTIKRRDMVNLQK